MGAPALVLCSYTVYAVFGARASREVGDVRTRCVARTLSGPCPNPTPLLPMPTPAFLQDQNPLEARQIEIDGKRYSYLDQFAWPGLATAAGLPATVAPIGRSQSGLPIGVQIIGPYLEDRTTIAVAAMLEREFGGFVPPPEFAA